MPKAKLRTFGQVIRDRRRRLNLSQQEVARRINTTTPYIGHIESGKRHPSKSIITKLAHVLELEPQEMFSLANTGAREPGPISDVPFVFVSYSWSDRELAHKLIEFLRRDNVAVQDSEGVAHDNGFDCAIKSADAVLVLIGPSGVPDESQLREWRFAREQAWARPDKLLVPVLLDGAKSPSFLADRAPFRANTATADADLNNLVRALRRPGKIGRTVALDEEHSRQREERLRYIGEAAESLKPS